MSGVPRQPFTTAKFAQSGGGIDFLGLRWVSLTIVGAYLVPELNNVTHDMGLFCLGAWIPWKFRQLCRRPTDYTESNYRSFQQKTEVAISMTFRPESNLGRANGKVIRQIGSTQTVSEPQKLTFRAAKRGDQNSLFAAANYGPAIRALQLIADSRSPTTTPGKFLRIPIPAEDEGTNKIASIVDETLRQSKNYDLLASLSEPPEVMWRDIHDLGECGLDPATYRGNAFDELKREFRMKLLPTSQNTLAYRRTLSARLLVATLRQHPNATKEEIRDAWYRGYFLNQTSIRLDESLANQHRCWSCLLARQHQRFPLEVFLWSFERALKDGARGIDETVNYWRQRSPNFEKVLAVPFRRFIRQTAGKLNGNDALTVSRTWNREVNFQDERFEHVPEANDDDAPHHALRMIASWYLRARTRIADPSNAEFVKLGGADRISMEWFMKWLDARLDCPTSHLVRDMFSELIFAQHIRVALARFDGQSQRLRFALSDSGIEPTVSARNDLAKARLPWMPDRLDSLIDLLCDCDVLAESDGKLTAGREADAV